MAVAAGLPGIGGPSIRTAPCCTFWWRESPRLTDAAHHPSEGYADHYTHRGRLGRISAGQSGLVCQSEVSRHGRGVPPGYPRGAADLTAGHAQPARDAFGGDVAGVGVRHDTANVDSDREALMKMRIDDLARELEIPSWQLLGKLEELGFFAVSDSTNLAASIVERVREAYGKPMPRPRPSEQAGQRYMGDPGQGSANSSPSEETPTPPQRRQRHIHPERNSHTRQRDSQRRPSPGEIWWAWVPYHDGSGGKNRPCVVVRTCEDGADVVETRSKYREGRVPLLTDFWDPSDERLCSWINLERTVRILTQRSNVAMLTSAEPGCGARSRRSIQPEDGPARVDRYESHHLVPAGTWACGQPVDDWAASASAVTSYT
jgi:Translation initiation factor IF-2, N-terminal region